MSEKCLVAMRLRAGTLTAEVPPEETEDVLAALARLYGKYWIAYVKDDTGRLWSWAYGEKRRGTASSWRVSPSIWRRGGEGGNHTSWLWTRPADGGAVKVGAARAASDRAVPNAAMIR